jgi:hypothetical protein
MDPADTSTGSDTSRSHEPGEPGESRRADRQYRAGESADLRLELSEGAAPVDVTASCSPDDSEPTAPSHLPSEQPGPTCDATAAVAREPGDGAGENYDDWVPL